MTSAAFAVAPDGERLTVNFNHLLLQEQSPTGAAVLRRAANVSADSELQRGAVIDGIDIVGPGSKVAIMLSADGRPIGFDVDWPRYRKLQKQQAALSAQTLRERASALSRVSFGADAVEVERFECGYVDMGSRRKQRDGAAPIQAGCGVHYSGRRFIAATAAQRAAIAQLPEDVQPHETHAQVDFIPAGVTVEPDRGWPQAIEAVECESAESADRSVTMHSCICEHADGRRSECNGQSSAESCCEPELDEGTISLSFDSVAGFCAQMCTSIAGLGELCQR